MILPSFEVIGEALRNAYNIGECIAPSCLCLHLVAGRLIRNTEQRERFFGALTHAINLSQREHSIRLDHTIPSIEEYWEYRLGSSAMNIVLAINE